MAADPAARGYRLGHFDLVRGCHLVHGCRLVHADLRGHGHLNLVRGSVEVRMLGDQTVRSCLDRNYQTQSLVTQSCASRSSVVRNLVVRGTAGQTPVGREIVRLSLTLTLGGQRCELVPDRQVHDPNVVGRSHCPALVLPLDVPEVLFLVDHAPCRLEFPVEIRGVPSEGLDDLLGLDDCLIHGKHQGRHYDVPRDPVRHDWSGGSPVVRGMPFFLLVGQIEDSHCGRLVRRRIRVNDVGGRFRHGEPSEHDVLLSFASQRNGVLPYFRDDHHLDVRSVLRDYLVAGDLQRCVVTFRGFREDLFVRSPADRAADDLRPAEDDSLRLGEPPSVAFGGFAENCYGAVLVCQPETAVRSLVDAGLPAVAHRARHSHCLRRRFLDDRGLLNRLDVLLHEADHLGDLSGGRHLVVLHRVRLASGDHRVVRPIVPHHDVRPADHPARRQRMRVSLQAVPRRYRQYVILAAPDEEQK